MARAENYICLAGRASCEIQPDGTIFACGWAQDESPALNIFHKGFSHAFYSLKKIKKCKSCAASCHLESNLIFSLHPATVLNWIQKLF
jgi:MoaA/NifB/PqqE/SkfB family radical SAM enzyme